MTSDQINDHVRELLFGYCGICYHPLDRCSHCDVGANCACQHDGCGTLVNECQEHQEIREQRDELLAALKAMMRYYDTPSGPSELLTQADAAIATAEGRTVEAAKSVRDASVSGETQTADPQDSKKS